MKVNENNPPREYKVGRGQISIKDMGKVSLEDDEQVTFITNNGAEYDLCKKSWGFYATPSINGRLVSFNFKTALIRNSQTCNFFVIIVERTKQSDFINYCLDENLKIVCWLDDEKILKEIVERIEKEQS